MAETNTDLHGSAPDNSAVALLLVDVINDLEFEGGERLLSPAVEMAGALARLKARAKALGIPVVYVNDNFGRWKSDFRSIVEHVKRDDCRGRPVAELLQPEDDDYFVLKPKHSGFFSTTLDTLLEHLGTRTVIVTGLATHICVMFTASDAYMRDFVVIVPEDCVAAADPEKDRAALELMREVLKADITRSDRLDLRSILRSAHPEQQP